MVAIVWLVRRGLLPVVPAHSASLRAFTLVFDGLWTRVNALMPETHIPEAVVMGSRFRGDDNMSTHISMSSATSRWGAEWVIQPEEA
jgi:hypothetical protein